jgi:DNA-binding LytR/AlgR family response regulator
MLIKCLIVDDEPPAVEELAYLLSKIDEIDIVGKAGSASRAIEAIETLAPDLVFLDIQMPERDGFEVIRRYMSSKGPPIFIFATAYDQYAVKAFDAEAVDYILKPFNEERVRKSVQRARDLLQTMKQVPLCQQVEKLVRQLENSPREVQKIPVESKGRIRVLDLEEIVFLKAENKGIDVYTKNESFLFHGQNSLDELEKKLRSFSFFRSHRSYLINLSFVIEIIPWFSGRYLVKLSDDKGSEVPVSRQRVKDLKTTLHI